MLNVPIKAQDKTFKSTKSIIPFIIMLVCYVDFEILNNPSKGKK